MADRFVAVYLTFVYGGHAPRRGVKYGAANRGTVAAPRGTYAERQQAERAEAQRRSRRSLRVGAAGIAVLFACGLGLWLLPDYALAFLAGMVVAILLILYAFLLVRGSVQTFKTEDRTRVP